MYEQSAEQRAQRRLDWMNELGKGRNENAASEFSQKNVNAYCYSFFSIPSDFKLYWLYECYIFVCILVKLPENRTRLLGSKQLFRNRRWKQRNQEHRVCPARQRKILGARFFLWNKFHVEHQTMNSEEEWFGKKSATSEKCTFLKWV